MTDPAFPDDGDYSVTQAGCSTDTHGQWLSVRINGRTVRRRISPGALHTLAVTAAASIGMRVVPVAATVAPKATVHALRPTTPGQAA